MNIDIFLKMIFDDDLNLWNKNARLKLMMTRNLNFSWFSSIPIIVSLDKY